MFVVPTMQRTPVYYCARSVRAMTNASWSELLNNKWSQNFDKRPHRWGDFSLGKLNLTLDCMLLRPANQWTFRRYTNAV